MNEPPKTWACAHAEPKDQYNYAERIVPPTARVVAWGKRCPVCNLSYLEHKALTERPTK